jgi:tetratricopeptide (TPR) repeat protein
MWSRLARFTALLFAFSWAGAAVSADAPVHSHAALGTVSFPVSCDKTVQSDFDRAVALLHHMTYPEARAAFTAIEQRDPSCAMARWGVAMTLFQPLWPTRPGKADLLLGSKTVEEGLGLGSANPREQAWLRSAAAFYRDPESTDYWKRIGDWESAMAEVHAAYPDDVEASVFYALALLASAQPGPAQQAHSEQAIALLLPVYREQPDHPGAMHYIIHANDIPGRARENLDITRQYEKTAPDNPHALHMPTHIYTRLGDWDGVIRGNLRAATAALNFPTGEHGELVWDEYAHAIEYLVYAYLQQGADADARAQITRLLAVPNLEVSAKSAFHLASTRARYALERHAWKEAAQLTPREPASVDWDRYPWPEAVSVFAVGYGDAQAGCGEAAREKSTRLEQLAERADAAREMVFAQQIRVLQLELSAAIARCAKNDAKAVAVMQQAVELETATPKPAVTPAPTLPASELLGDLLLQLDRPSDARAAYEKSLQVYPRRFNSELGLARARKASGDSAGATRAYCDLLKIAKSGTRADSVDDVQRFVATQRSEKKSCTAIEQPSTK